MSGITRAQYLINPMRIITKRTKVISMTHEEHELFLRCMMAAKEGHTSHYAEEKLDDGSFLGVSVVERPEPTEDYKRNCKGQKNAHKRY